MKRKEPTAGTFIKRGFFLGLGFAIAGPAGAVLADVAAEVASELVD